MSYVREPEYVRLSVRLVSPFTGNRPDRFTLATTTHRTVSREAREVQRNLRGRKQLHDSRGVDGNVFLCKGVGLFPDLFAKGDRGYLEPRLVKAPSSHEAIFSGLRFCFFSDSTRQNQRKYY